MSHYYQKFRTALENLPAPGGNGCHNALLGLANYGLLAGLSQQEVFDHIRAAIPVGRRKVPDREIVDAIKRAAIDFSNHTWKPQYIPKPQPLILNGADKLRRIIEQSQVRDEADLWELSPIRIDWPPEEDTARFLSCLYEPSDLLLLGEKMEPGIVGENIRTVSEWIKIFT